MKKLLLTTFILLSSSSIALAAPPWIYQRTILPEANNAYDIGTSSLLWRNIYYAGNLVNTGLSNGCASWLNGVLTSLGVACGSGSGGGSGGTFSTTTSQVSGRLINYPNNNTDIVTVGGSATTSAKTYFDPNTNQNIFTGTVNVGAQGLTNYSPYSLSLTTGSTTLPVSMFGINDLSQAATHGGDPILMFGYNLLPGDSAARASSTEPQLLQRLEGKVDNVSDSNASMMEWDVDFTKANGNTYRDFLIQNYRDKVQLDHFEQATSWYWVDATLPWSSAPNLAASLMYLSTSTGLHIGNGGLSVGISSSNAGDGIIQASSSAFLAVNAGTVGLGTKTPEAFVDIKDTASENQNIILRNTGALHTGLIGTNSSSGVLSDNNAWGIFGGNNTYLWGGGSAYQAGFVLGSGVPAWNIRFTTGNLNSATGITALTVLSSNGNVGIGTTSPASKLTVNGQVQAGTFLASTTNATSTFEGAVSVRGMASTSLLSVSGTATSTFTAGLNVKTGCIAVNGVCISPSSGGSSGTVTSVDMSVPTGLTISGNPVTTSGTLGLSLTTGYTMPVAANLLATSSNFSTNGQLVAVSGTNTVYPVATSSIGATSPITFSGTAGAQVGGTAGTYGCTTASSGVAGCLSNTSFDTFNGKLSSVTADSPLSGSGTSGSHLVIANAAADGSTKGAASFTAADFNDSSGNISIDYTNGQAASAILKGFLTLADWNTFNNKVATGTAETRSNLAFWTSNAGTPPQLGSVATTSISCTGFITCTGFNALGAASSITTTGQLGVANGGTAAATFGQGWINSSGGTAALSASTSPTVAWITATSTTATSTFYGRLQVNDFASTSQLSVSGSATSTFTAGVNIKTGCFAVNNTCVSGSGGGGSGTVTSVATNNGLTGGTITTTGTLGLDLSQIQNSPLVYWNGSRLAATTTPTANNYIATSSIASIFPYASTTAISSGNAWFTGNVAVGTTTPTYPLDVYANGTPQIALSSGAGYPQWIQANEFGTFYIGTTTTAGNATTTIPALSITSTGTTTIAGDEIVGNGATTAFQIDTKGHKITSGTTPTCDANCTFIAGNDNAFRVQFGTSKTTSTVSFGASWGTISPICVSNEGSAGTVAVSASSTPTTVVLTALSSLSNVDVEVVCEGIQ